jgi:hypothetical protein
MKLALKVIGLIFKVLFRVSLFSLKAFWLVSVYIFNCIDDDYDDEQVMFSYGDDHTGDPSNTTVRGRSFTPGQSIPLYKLY